MIKNSPDLLSWVEATAALQHRLSLRVFGQVHRTAAKQKPVLLRVKAASLK